MRTQKFFAFGAVLLLGASVGLVGCGDDDEGGGGSSGSGGTGAQGGSAGNTSGGTGAQGGSAGNTSGGTGATGATGGSAGAATGGSAGAATGGSAGAATGGTGGSAGSATGGTGGGSAAEAFCARYEKECGYGGTDRYADQAACVTKYETSGESACYETHLGFVESGQPASTHCPHATGIGACP